jgi:serine/threonine protein kinase
LRKFGKYEVVREIGAGGFGKVYEGFDPGLRRRVAIKTCISDDAGIRARFEREALIVAALQHPNITTVHDFGNQDGVPFLVQEYLSGQDLSQIIERGDDVPTRARLEILIAIARGLEHAHEQGIIHRDVKPANVRVLVDGAVKVMDFGIAKLASFETKLTRTGTLVGTAAYLAPEQIQGEELDGRCDIFAFGVLAFELLTLRRPFVAETVSNLIFQILQRPAPRLNEVWPGAPEDLCALVDACLEKDRERRPPNFGVVRERLEALRPSLLMTGVVGSTASGLAARELSKAGTGTDNSGPDLQTLGTSPSRTGPSGMGPSGTGAVSSEQPTLALPASGGRTMPAPGPRATLRATAPRTASGGGGDVEGTSYGEVRRPRWFSGGRAVAVLLAIAVVGGGSVLWLTSIGDEAPFVEPEPRLASAVPAVGAGEGSDTAAQRSVALSGSDAGEAALSAGTSSPAVSAPSSVLPDSVPPDPSVSDVPAVPAGGAGDVVGIAEEVEKENESSGPSATRAGPSTVKSPLPPSSRDRPPAGSFDGRRPGGAAAELSERDRQQIRQLLEDFSSAYEERKLLRLRELFPQMPQPMIARLRRTQAPQTLEVERDQCAMERAPGTGMRVAVSCPILQTIVTPSGQARSVTGHPTFVVRKTPNGWVIDHVERFDDASP